MGSSRQLGKHTSLVGQPPPWSTCIIDKQQQPPSPHPVQPGRHAGTRFLSFCTRVSSPTCTRNQASARLRLPTNFEAGHTHSSTQEPFRQQGRAADRLRTQFDSQCTTHLAKTHQARCKITVRIAPIRLDRLFQGPSLQQSVSSDPTHIARAAFHSRHFMLMVYCPASTNRTMDLILSARGSGTGTK